jgi:hypothetical protein
MIHEIRVFSEIVLFRENKLELFQVMIHSTFVVGFSAK